MGKVTRGHTELEGDNAGRKEPWWMREETLMEK